MGDSVRVGGSKLHLVLAQAQDTFHQKIHISRDTINYTMVEVSTIVGIAFMVMGSLLVSIGLFLCYTTKVY